MKYRPANIDELPEGTWVYAAPETPLGVIAIHWECRGNRPAVARRCLISGAIRKYAYQRIIDYREARKAGVLVVADREVSA